MVAPTPIVAMLMSNNNVTGQYPHLGYLTIVVLPRSFTILETRPVANLQARRKMKIVVAQSG
jgi:hypothetical protein